VILNYINFSSRRLFAHLETEQEQLDLLEEQIEKARPYHHMGLLLSISLFFHFCQKPIFYMLTKKWIPVDVWALINLITSLILFTGMLVAEYLTPERLLCNKA